MRTIFGFPTHSDAWGPSYTPALSGGSWLAALPLTNLQDRRLHKVARSADALAASTKFTVDLGVARAVRVLALVNHNISSAGTVRFRGYSDAGLTTLVYDSTAINAWPSSVAAAWAATAAEAYQNYVRTALHVAATAQSARYWLVEVSDTGNSDGYVQIGRLMICGGYEPTYHYAPGKKLGWETSSSRQETDGGAVIHNRRARRRVVQCAFENTPLNESLAYVFEMQKELGTDGQLFVVLDPDDATNLHRQSFLCTMKELTALEARNYQYNHTYFALIEEL